MKPTRLTRCISQLKLLRRMAARSFGDARHYFGEGQRGRGLRALARGHRIKADAQRLKHEVFMMLGALMSQRTHFDRQTVAS